MTPDPLRSWDVELRQDLRRRGDQIAVDVEAALRAVQARTTRRQQRLRPNRSLGAVLATATAVLAIAFASRAFETNRSGQTPTTTTDGSSIVLPEGTYRYWLSDDDLNAASRGRVSPQDISNNAGAWTWRLQDGHWDLNLKPAASSADPAYPCSGDVTMEGDLATFVRTVNLNPKGECAPSTWSARFVVRGGVVHWSDVSVPGFGWFFATKPWIRH